MGYYNHLRLKNMKNKIEEIAVKFSTDLNKKKINRKEAIKKTAYIAVSAATMMILLSNPSKAATGSAAPPPAWY